VSPLQPVGAWRRAWHRYRRQNRFLIAAFVILLLLSLGGFFVLQRAQEASPDELTNRLLLFVLWYLDLSLIVILTFILVRSLVRLGFERRSGILGSRFRTKLVLTYVGLTFVPVLFIFLIATNLLQRSIDFWFSAPVEKIVTGGREVAVALRERMEDRLEEQVERAAELIGIDPSQDRLPGLRRTLGVDVVAVYRGRSLVAAVADPQRIQTGIPPPPFDVPSGVRADRWRGGLLVRAWRPAGNDGLTVLVGDVLPADVLQPVLDALAREDEYQQLKAQRGTLTATAVLVFLAVTLLLLFATVWIGLYLSRRFTQPLLAVAAATQRVAEGDEPEEVAIPASDEVAVLVHSFNAMVRRVRATEEEILASNQELATLLATIPTGVLSLDLETDRFRPNPAAATMLGEASWLGRWVAMQELDRPGLATLGARLRPPRLREGRSEVELEVGGATRYLEVTTSPLSDGGWVAAMDDLSQLVRAQRQAAWSEVAQRIAHEIKNPLTPIRLAAERVQRRAAGVGAELQEVIDSSCAAIVAQVDGLRELLDAFRQYARMPLVEPRPVAVEQIVREVASLYDGLREDLRVDVEIDGDRLVGLVDPAPLRQALVNLVDNAVDATPGPGRIVLSAQRVGDEIEIAVRDTGTGLPTQDPETLLQPFFSTKGRGSGMGLALVHRVVTDHGGSLRLENVEPHGARVTILLPAVPAASGAPDEPVGDAAR
jgi:nitrogen fixation/metabolism regulation signal transduction histidine kinase